MTASAFRRLIGSFAVDQPRYAEAIDDHAKTCGPERFFERQYNPTVPGQLMKDTLGVRGVLDLEREREPLRHLVAFRGHVGTHQHLLANRHAAVHDLVLPVG